MSGKRTQIEVNKEKVGASSLTIALLIAITILATLGVILTPRSNEFRPILDDVILNLLNLATDVLYLLGGGLIFFGVLLVTMRFVRIKLKDPYKPSGVSRFLSGYLTLGLEFFIGAEIIKTIVVRDFEEFSLLILVIISRGLFSLILYLERRWHGTAETE